MNDRRQKEFDLVRKTYGEISVGPSQDWVVIKQYGLPPGWNKVETELLIKIPPGYPNTPLDNFYTDNDLRLESGQQPASTSPNQNIQNKHWLQFS